MNISWAADTTAGHSVVEYTTLKDRSWRRSRTVEPSLEQLCEVFDSVYSKHAVTLSLLDRNGKLLDRVVMNKQAAF